MQCSIYFLLPRRKRMSEVASCEQTDTIPNPWRISMSLEGVEILLGLGMVTIAYNLPPHSSSILQKMRE
jgi:hypothetical protein